MSWKDDKQMEDLRKELLRVLKSTVDSNGQMLDEYVCLLDRLVAAAKKAEPKYFFVYHKNYGYGNYIVCAKDAEEARRIAFQQMKEDSAYPSDELPSDDDFYSIDDFEMNEYILPGPGEAKTLGSCDDINWEDYR
jgi:hypothetical protein